jgi:WD40 repeat protein
MRCLLLSCALTTAGLALSAAPASAQADRRHRQFPELVLETGGRTAACDHLTFTPDGKELLAVGDDKVVRIWAYENGKLSPKSRVLRWPIWREQRGAIYALALSHDREAKRIAIAGYGSMPHNVAVLDRETGRILQSEPLPVLGDAFGIRALAFDPADRRLAVGTPQGAVLLWDLTKPMAWEKRPREKWENPIVLDEPAPIEAIIVPGGEPIADTLNQVRFLRFLDDNRLLVVTENGNVTEWDLSGGREVPKPLPRIKSKDFGKLLRVALSPRGDWLACATDNRVLAIRSLDGKRQKDVYLKEGEFGRTVQFDPKEDRLAVSVGSLPEGSRFHMEADDRIVFYDLSQQPPAPVAGPLHAGRAEFFAFHPKDRALAVAGGNHHEVTLWDLANLKAPADRVQGEGRCLWAVALSKNGDYIGFKSERNPASRDPNDRARGPWRVFDLLKRNFPKNLDDFKPIAQLTETRDWRVEPHPTDPYVWYAVYRDKQRFPLPLNRDRELMPRCWAFVEADKDNPVRLLVGHHNGFSVLELTASGVRRTRICTGHQGDVTALAVSDDKTWVLTCSNDQTLAGWSLGHKWKSQELLGARFVREGARLRVKAVDVGSPAWEAGLEEGDEVTRFAFRGKFLDEGGPAAWLKHLEDPTPGVEHYFVVARGKKTENVLTTVRQRPLWRFLPTTDARTGIDEYVLWMWQNHYYDTSTKGDYKIGWHINGVKLTDTPRLILANQLEKEYRKRPVINVLLATRNLQDALRTALRQAAGNPVPVRFDDREPPDAHVVLGARVVKDDQNGTADLEVRARTDNPDYRPVRAELWVNDFRLKQWTDFRDWKEKDDRLWLKGLEIPNEYLRTGPRPNVVTFQVFNKAGGRAEERKELVCQRAKAPNPRLLGVAMGINDYKAAGLAGGKRALGDLESAVEDAKELRLLLNRQKLYAEPNVVLQPEKEATHDGILAALDRLTKGTRADDSCVIFLGGHGVWVDDPREEGRQIFVFCPRDFNPKKPLETGISRDVLVQKLAAIPCRKLVIFDACHSGVAADSGTTESPARELLPQGLGPVVLASCDRNQKSYEDKKFGHGLFTKAILEALDKESSKADANGDGYIDQDELILYTRRRVPELLQEIGLAPGVQLPTAFVPDQETEPFRLAKRDKP